MDSTHDAVLARQPQALALLRAAGILPILTVDSVSQAQAIADALLQGGLHSIELTLRTPAALESIAALKRSFPTLCIGAGTVVEPDHVRAAEDAGADFIVTPGTTPALRDALVASTLPVVAGAATPSEVLVLAELGYRVAKLFPAAAVGGATMLKALQGPISEMRFCPTGGIGENDAAAYLALPNVACVGGSWMLAPAWIAAGEFGKVRDSAARARTIVDSRI
ncbi:bifunctional 4-hydroxy-2-oxoglutarate aldolase/2-dehydro-3-deoxy-phosphogluconate aldolase [soil metagenome]